ncbi:hypothetical protein CXF67_05830 [Psychroflexus sp. MES1-P1E]|nr:hypothetical protein CXF67_05830 [Psychroflexus sp. MES1-P1E]
MVTNLLSVKLLQSIGGTFDFYFKNFKSGWQDYLSKVGDPKMGLLLIKSQNAYSVYWVFLSSVRF